MIAPEIHEILAKHGAAITEALVDELMDVAEKRARTLLQLARAEINRESTSARGRSRERWHGQQANARDAQLAANLERASTIVAAVIDQTI